MLYKSCRTSSAEFLKENLAALDMAHTSSSVTASSPSAEASVSVRLAHHYSLYNHCEHSLVKTVRPSSSTSILSSAILPISSVVLPLPITSAKSRTRFKICLLYEEYLLNALQAPLPALSQAIQNNSTTHNNIAKFLMAI